MNDFSLMTNVDSLAKISKKFSIQNVLMNHSGATRTLSRLSSTPTIHINNSLRTDPLSPEICDHHQSQGKGTNHVLDESFLDKEGNNDGTHQDIQHYHWNMDHFDPEPAEQVTPPTSDNAQLDSSLHVTPSSKTIVELNHLIVYQTHLEYTLN